jgi:hypothetical protein
VSEICDVEIEESVLSLAVHPVPAFVQNCQVAVGTDAEDPLLIAA